MAKNCNWGIIAPGKIAGKFANDLQLVPGAKLHAVASRSLDRARTFAQHYQAPNCYGSYEELMHCPDLDIVYIASPHPWHHEHTLLCLNNGIPVLCEKPFAMNSQQLAQMLALAAEKKVFLMEALWTRFLPSIQKMLELVKSGAIGELKSVKADFCFAGTYNPSSRLYNLELGGGSLLDIGIYPVFLSLLLLGRPEEIQATARLAPTGADEECGMLFRYAGGQIAHLHSSFNYWSKTEAYIYGTEGVIQLHTRWHESKSMTIYKKDADPQEIHFDYEGKGYRFEAAEAMACLERGALESKLLPHTFSKDLLTILDEVRAKTGIVYEI